MALVTLVAGVSVGCHAQTPPPVAPSTVLDTLAPRSGVSERPSPAVRAYTEAGPSADGTGRFYMGREIARVMSHRGAAWLEREEREVEERPDLLIGALGLRETDVVADLGAGTGYFTFRMAPLVPRGQVFAVDIQPEMLTILEARAEAEGVRNVVPVWGTETSPRLADASVDLSLLVDSYHEFFYPREMLAGIYAATRPGGRLVLVEYRAEDADVPIRRLHKMTEAQVRLEVEASGFRFVGNTPVLPMQHLLVFERPR